MIHKNISVGQGKAREGVSCGQKRERAKHVFTFDPRLRRSCAGPGFKGGTPIANLASKVTTHLPRLGSGQNMALKHRPSTECLNKII